MSAPPTAEQIEILLTYLEEHQDLARGHLRDVSGRARTREMWQDLTNSLNACGGTVKTVKQWQRVWADRKYLAKRAASTARQSATATGGGPSTAPPISEIEHRIIAIMGEGFGRQQVEGRVPTFYPVEEPASAASSAPLYEVASQDDPSADEERELPHSAASQPAASTCRPVASSSASQPAASTCRPVASSSASQPAASTCRPVASSSQNPGQNIPEPRAQPARRTLRARRAFPGESLGSRIIGLEEQRLNIEQRRAAIEERRAAIEERRAAIEERQIAVNELLVTELQQLRLAIRETMREVIQLLSRQQ